MYVQTDRQTFLPRAPSVTCPAHHNDLLVAQLPPCTIAGQLLEPP